MKLFFSEYKSDYANYIFPYAIWAIPEAHETPGMIFGRGFLPASRQLDRFYMCRQIRIKLDRFSRSSENRRILRKCQNIECRLVPRADFEFTPAWRRFCKRYADIKFGKDIMTVERLDSLLNSRIVSHLLVYRDAERGEDVGLVTLYLEPPLLSFYYYAFYDLNYYAQNLGMYMMTSSVDYFADEKFDFLYLGSCYSRNALYKTQFAGAQFFTGFSWSDNLKELKFLIERDRGPVKQHLLETEGFLNRFYSGGLQEIAAETESAFRID